MHSKHRLQDSGKIVKNKFTEAEDVKLASLVRKYGDQDWKKISKEMGNRNARQCRERWKNYIAPTVRKDEWTQEEDELLMRKYRAIGPHWSQFRLHYKGRSVNDIRNRWLKLMRLERKGKSIKSIMRRSGSNQDMSTEYETENTTENEIENLSIKEIEGKVEDAKKEEVIEFEKKESTPFDFLTDNTTFNLFSNSGDDNFAIFQLLDFYY